ncbi:hypothetical protein BDP27DRAFT_714798 [Rhodocollybia butyracea]|uniref:Uncharacterized protein n=1 Tax=Rhodocollybia butyracea TaxID=206335 RepID=A0A9P5Q7R7_9AGAR|nr:hypothetical protein BDP27DRAFT_714798 [Rhodocollybia butyracea]
MSREQECRASTITSRDHNMFSSSATLSAFQKLPLLVDSFWKICLPILPPPPRNVFALHYLKHLIFHAANEVLFHWRRFVANRKAITPSLGEGFAVYLPFGVELAASLQSGCSHRGPRCGRSRHFPLPSYILNLDTNLQLGCRLPGTSFPRTHRHGEVPTE